MSKVVIVRCPKCSRILAECNEMECVIKYRGRRYTVHAITQIECDQCHHKFVVQLKPTHQATPKGMEEIKK
jgi:DNA-directed RNA polymerase subunit RPC12/RpoP